MQTLRNLLFAPVLVALSLCCLAGAAEAAKKPPATVLDLGETAHLTFMREEEKLARDVYLTLGELYPAYPVFASIDDSEQRHFDTMGAKLDQYNVTDPSTDNTVGAFTGADYGAYFSEKFELLVGSGEAGVLQALLVGAFIEELDMHDIRHCPEAIVEADNGIDEGECGLEYTDERALQKSYEQLLEGSMNHLRAFVKNIEGLTGEPYVAQYLSQEEVDAILGR